MRPQAELSEEKVCTRSVQGTFVSWFRFSDGDSGGHGVGGGRGHMPRQGGTGTNIITGTNMNERKWTQTIFFHSVGCFRVLLKSFGKARNNKVF